MTDKLSLGICTSGGKDYTATNGYSLTIMTCDNVKTSRRPDFHPIPGYIWVFDAQHMQTASLLPTPYAVVQKAASWKDKTVSECFKTY